MFNHREVNFETSDFLLLASVSPLSCERKCDILVYFFPLLHEQFPWFIWDACIQWPCEILLSLVKIHNRLIKLSWLRQFCLVFFAASDSLLTPDKWKWPCDLCFWCSALWCGVRTALLWLSDVVMITWAAWGLGQWSLFCGCWSLSGKLHIPVSFTQFDVRFDFIIP